MQPFDALTIRAVVFEAKPLIVNRKVDKILQLGRDEIAIALRSRTGICNLLLSAHAVFGRVCLVNLAPQVRRANPPAFCMLLRKHLSGATLVGVEQMLGERIVDLVFSCIDEIGKPSLKVLSAEIMGRHSNLIFWDKENDQILGASHVVTRQMSRQREIAPGLTYVRPPRQEKPNIFKIKKDEFLSECQGLKEKIAGAGTVEQWLTNTLAGLGRHLAEELVGMLEAKGEEEELRERIWQQIEQLQATTSYKPAMLHDLSRYSVLSLWETSHDPDLWKQFPSVNDMIDEYFRALEIKDRFEQTRERLLSELRAEKEKLALRLAAAERNLAEGDDASRFKRWGDLILTHIDSIKHGQSEFACHDLMGDNALVSIPLAADLSASANAQAYYRQFAKARTRTATARAVKAEVAEKGKIVDTRIEQIEAAAHMDQLEQVRAALGGRPEGLPPKAVPAHKKGKAKLLSLVSSDGWTIVVGRNRHENDEIVSRVAQPHDIWMHVLGQGGAHVLIKVPAKKQDCPPNTLKEAAQAAARLSKAVAGGKVRVVYTHCRNLKKVPGNKPGVVRYENERTIEVDTAGPMPQALKQLFSPGHKGRERPRGS